ncbi:ABC transporter substrate-binding protein [Anaerobacterium chartisolvens]|uniref:ABC transporter substrate-binding protein n=1 Tax=Anaerobacterium chartisolvens TaxID=1297424 RepID=UPI0011C031F1|nr:ABC transporter substrate-binding protein [Anaerobacterium chartisolvens]
MKRIVCILLILCLSTALISCNKKTDAKVINFWSGWSLIGDEELENSQDEWLLKRLLKEYDDMNEDIQIKFTYVEDEDAMFQMLKTSMLDAKDAPDIVVLQNESYVKEIAGILLPLNTYIDKQFIDNNTFWETVTTGKGDIIGYPVAGCEVSLILYNKDIIKQAGLDFENAPPKTSDEFMDVLEAIKAKGIQPIIASESEFNNLYTTLFSTWWLQDAEEGQLKKLMDGTAKFSEDKLFIDSLKYSQECFEKGYINVDYITNTTSQMDFIQGKAAFYPTSNCEFGIFYEAMGDQLGMLPIPRAKSHSKDLNFGGVNQCISVIKSTKYPKECNDIISWMLNKENSIKMYKTFKTLPVRKDVSIEDLGWKDDELYEEIFRLKDSVQIYPYAVMGTELREMFFRLGAQTQVNKMKAEELAKALDDKIKQSEK